MVISLVWREYRGLFKAPVFYLIVLAMILLPALRSMLGSSFRFAVSYIGFFACFSMLWLFLQDLKTKEAQWLFLLPVRRRTVFLAKYLAGLPFVGWLFLPDFDITGTGGLSLSLPARIVCYLLYYSFWFVVAKLTFDLSEPR